MSLIRLPRLIRGLTFVKTGLCSYKRRWAGTVNAGPTVRARHWTIDPTYRKISPPNSIQWTMPTVPQEIQRPHYSENGTVSPWYDVIPLALPIGPSEWYDPYLLDGMRKAGRLAAESLEYAVSLVKPGVTTREIDRKLTEWAFSRCCYPSSLNYGRFPGSLCTSVNNVLSHGVPNDQALVEGSIINLDVALYVPFEPAGTSYHGDTSTTVAVGDLNSLSDNSRLLMKATKEALEAGIAACGPFQPYSGIGQAISTVAREYGLTVVPELSGHGIGREYHQYPLILHCDNDDPGEMAPGTIFTIEPCLTEGNGVYKVDPQDKWSLYSVDGARGALEEHTVMITDTGVEVLTRS